MPEKPEAEEVKLVVNPVMAALDPQTMDPRCFTVLVGYIGEVADEFVRVYPQLDLRTYFLVPRNAIKFAEPADASRVSSPTRLVIDESVEIEIVKFGTRTISAGFLAGAISAANLPTAQPPHAPGKEFPPGTSILAVPCPSGGVFAQPQPQPHPIGHSKCSSPCYTSAISWLG